MALQVYEELKVEMSETGSDLNQEVMRMEKQEVGVIDWIKEHRRQLIATGIGIGTILLIVMAIKNKDDIAKLLKSLKDAIAQTPVTTAVDDIQGITESLTTNEALGGELAETTRKYTISATPYTVSSHVRKLPEGQKASLKKIEEATQLGITLLPNETLVDEYVKGGLAA